MFAKKVKLLPELGKHSESVITQQEWFTVDEAAEYLRVCKRTIYRLCQEGGLVGYRTRKGG